MVRVVALCAMFAATATLGLGAGVEPRRFEFVETHMGSPFKIVLYTDDEALARRASRAAYERIAALDRCFSDYDVDSELSKLGDKAGGPPVPVSDDLFAILKLSKAFAKSSAGAFDPTIAPVGRLWRRARRERKLPDPDLLKKALALVGHDRLLLDEKARTARLTTAGMRLDLGGIAKGYASQAALDVLAGHGVKSALVGGAGDIAVGDPPPGKKGWTVAVASLESPDTAPAERYIEVANVGVSTSGDAERYVEIDGVRYSHILDPATGLGLKTRSSVTVVAKRGEIADPVATAASVMGPKKGKAFVRETGADCLFVEGVGADRREVSTSQRIFGRKTP